VVKADAAFASIKLFSLGPSSSFGSQKLGMRRCGYDRSEIASCESQVGFVAQVKETDYFQMKLNRQAKEGRRRHGVHTLCASDGLSKSLRLRPARQLVLCEDRRPAYD